MNWWKVELLFFITYINKNVIKIVNNWHGLIKSYEPPEPLENVI